MCPFRTHFLWLTAPDLALLNFISPFPLPLILPFFLFPGMGDGSHSLEHSFLGFWLTASTFWDPRFSEPKPWEARCAIAVTLREHVPHNCVPWFTSFALFSKQLSTSALGCCCLNCFEVFSLPSVMFVNASLLGPFGLFAVSQFWDSFSVLELSLGSFLRTVRWGKCAFYLGSFYFLGDSLGYAV